MKYLALQTLVGAALIFASVNIAVPVAAFERVAGRVEVGGGAIVKADVTLWVAGPGAPKKLAETQTKEDGSFDLKIAGEMDAAGVMYLIANGPNPSITLMATLGTTPRGV